MLSRDEKFKNPMATQWLMCSVYKYKIKNTISKTYNIGTSFRNNTSIIH